eukprot:NODE_284_length_2490_cov_2.486246_g263_i0.p1 GENE.NODE_284_length_2490_cov_2.486246_g263_i0~~NODE_284_length_2490_cov_2.486246_g263_i0.p1  ORF type:complete len:795 (+),score=190.36 NODE_284_length_2490_cov_2.486246_g263_i0:2-2386(+)
MRKALASPLEPMSMAEAVANSSPLMVSHTGAGEDVIGFFHRGIQEYFVATWLLQHSGALAALREWALAPHDDILRFFGTLYQLKSEEERCAIRDNLMHIVLASRTDPAMHVPASNAISLLNASDISFCKMDLSSIAIPNANLQSAILMDANLSGANIKGVDLQGAILVNTNLEAADLSGAKLGTLIRTMKTHQRDVWAISLSRDKTTLASASGDRSICLFAVATGELLSRMTGHSESVWDVTFSPNGRRLASCGNEGQVIIWSIKQRRIKFRCIGHTKPVWYIVYSADGGFVFSCSSDGTVRAWNTHTGLCWRCYDGFGDLRALDLSPLVNAFACASDNDLYLVSIDSGEQLMKFEGHERDVFTLDFSPHGLHLASGGTEKSIRIWDTETGKQLHALSTPIIWAVLYSPRGDQLACGSQDGSVTLWETENYDLVHRLPSAGRSPVWALSWLRNGAVLASGSGDGSIRVWRSELPEVLKSQQNGHNSPIAAVLFTDTVWSFANTQLLGWCGDTGLQVRQPDLPPLVAVAVAGDRLAAMCENGELHCWTHPSADTKCIPMMWSFTLMAFAPNHRFLALAAGNKVGLFTFPDHTFHPFPATHMGPVCAVACAPDSLRVATASTDGVKVWDVATLSLLCTLAGPHPVASVAFSDQSQTLFTGCEGALLHSWNLETHTLIFTAPQPVVPRCLQCSPKNVLAVNRASKIALLDASDMTLRTLLRGHTGTVTSLAFNLEGDLLASGAKDCSVMVWQVKDSLLRFCFRSHADRLPKTITSTMDLTANLTGSLLDSFVDLVPE